MGFQEKKRVRIESFTSSQALERESKLLDLGNDLFYHLSSILNLKMYLGFLSFNALVGFSLKRENSAHFKNSDLTLSLKRGILAQARISLSQQSQNAISRPGETTLAQARILQYSSGFHPLRQLLMVMHENATFHVDEEHKDYIMKSVDKALREFRTNCGKCIRDDEGNVNLKPPAKYANLIDEADWVEFVIYRTKDEKFLKISEQNRNRASNPIYPYSASRMGYRGLEQSKTPSSAAVDLNVLWVDARKNKQGYPKKKESFCTADSQVLLEKALGLPQYLGRIHDAGFGASKQFVTPSTKRLTKADAVVMQDKYYSLAEQFHTMEKRMEAGKFVEGPEASTTGIINNCKLFLDTPCTRAVAIGTVYNTHDAIIHHAQIPSNHLKVSIDISIEDDALLPIPVEEDIITVGLALATFVAWPKHLIDIVPIMMSADDHSATSPPRIDEPASKKAKMVKSTPHSSKSNLESSGENLHVDSTINISLPEPIYGYSTEEFITKNDVKDVHDRDWIGASVLSVYLYDNFVPKSKKKVMFISPQANILGA
ncbi:hypothetical protein Lal_00012757, partial [Lupinus albus]